MILPAAHDTRHDAAAQEFAYRLARAQKLACQVDAETPCSIAPASSGWNAASRCRPALATRMSIVPNSLDHAREHVRDLILGRNIGFVGIGLDAGLADFVDHGVRPRHRR